MTAVNNNNTPKTPLVRTAASPAPAAPVATTAVPTGDALALKGPAAAANATAGGDEFNFNDFNAFKAFADSTFGQLSSAIQAQNQSHQQLSAATSAQAAADNSLGKSMRDLQGLVEQTRSQYQAPIDDLSNRLQGAQAELDAAAHPGRGHANELSNEASQVQNQLDGVSQQIAGVQVNIDRLSNEIGNANQTYTEANAERQRIAIEVATLSSKVAPGRLENANVAVAQADVNVQNARAAVQAAQAKLQHLQEAAAAATAAANAAAAPAAATPTPPAPVSNNRPAPPSGTPATSANGPTPPTTTTHSLYGAPATPPANATPPHVAVPGASGTTVKNPYAQHGAGGSATNNPYGGETPTAGQISAAQATVDAATRQLQLAQNLQQSAHDRQADIAGAANTINNDRARDGELAGMAAGAAGTINGDRAALGAGQQRLADLQGQAGGIAQQRDALRNEANQEANRLAPSDDPSYAAARNKVGQLQGQLQQARDTFSEKMSDPQSRLTAARAKYQADMGPANDAVNRAQGAVSRDDQAVAGLKGTISRLKDWGPGVFHWGFGSSVKSYWKAEGKNKLSSVGM